MNVDAFHSRLRELYLPPAGEFTLVDVPEVRYAVIDGEGDPATDAAATAVKWLYSIAHLVKPMVKERMGKNFAEPPLEWVSRVEDPELLRRGIRERWSWSMMIVFVDWITDEQFNEAVHQLEQQRGPAPGSLRLAVLHEGQCVQRMHIGDYEGSKDLCETLYGQYLPTNGLKPRGSYHEIYLNDPKRTAPEKRRMVIRQPVTPIASGEGVSACQGSGLADMVPA